MERYLHLDRTPKYLKIKIEKDQLANKKIKNDFSKAPYYSNSHKVDYVLTS